MARLKHRRCNRWSRTLLVRTGRKRGSVVRGSGARHLSPPAHHLARLIRTAFPATLSTPPAWPSSVMQSVAVRTSTRVGLTARFARSGVRCAAGMSGSVTYPTPIVFKALGEHKSTLVMLHGLGESCGLIHNLGSLLCDGFASEPDGGRGQQQGRASCSPRRSPPARRHSRCRWLLQAIRGLAGLTLLPCWAQTYPTPSSSSPRPPR